MIYFDNLGLTIELRTDSVDLTRDRLGQQCLDFAEAGMLRTAQSERAPDLTPWAPIARKTARAKGSDRIGYATGAMIGALNAGERSIEPHRATWSYPQGATYARALGFHTGGNGRPARPLVGWTATARDQVSALLRDDTLEQDQNPTDDTSTKS